VRESWFAALRSAERPQYKTGDLAHWVFRMIEKPESADEFEDEDGEEVAGGDETLDVDRLIQDLDKRKRGAPKGAEPAWRKLERMMEQKRTSELLSDFDDYDVDERPKRK
jgi:hypothetical protein